MTTIFFSDYVEWQKKLKKEYKEMDKVKYELGEVKVFVHCEYHKVEKIIEKEYGFKEYSIPASEEVGNDITLEFTVDGEMDKWEKEAVAGKKEMYSTRLYLNDLARQGKIQKGEYLVRISW
jgi:hypothetical protein